MKTQPRDPAMPATPLLDDDRGPDGKPLDTPMDRRWLWHLDAVLSMHTDSAPALRAIRTKLGRYLRSTCTHRWIQYRGGDAESAWMPPHQQCLWCHTVQWQDTPIPGAQPTTPTNEGDQ